MGGHLTRAARHATIGNALADAGDEWSAVCYFYSAYHYVRATLVADPVFDELTRLKTFNPNLMSDDRHTETHHGTRKPGHRFGVNELVKLLYPSIYNRYEYLHQASIQVRYNMGLRFPIAQVRASHKLVEDSATSGLSA